MPLNTKDDPITDSDLDDLEFSTEVYWYDDGRRIYPRRFVVVNGTVLSKEDAKELYDELHMLHNR